MRQSIIEKIEKRETKIIPTTTVGFSKPEKKILTLRREYELNSSFKSKLVYFIYFIHLIICVYLVCN